MKKRNTKNNYELNFNLIIIILLFCNFLSFSETYYVSTAGNNSNNGTKDNPFQTIVYAYNKLLPSDTVLVFPGDYSSTGLVQLIGNHGEENKYLHIIALDNFDKPLIRTKLILKNTSYLHMQGFEITTGQMLMSGEDVNNCIIENFDIHNVNDQQGLSITNLAHDNLILNCDFHDNIQFNGSNSDGLAIWAAEPTSTNGPYNNIVRGCRSYFNNDDGFDAWCSGFGNRFENCWSFGNGRDRNFNKIMGDGNGFKLGQGKYTHVTVVQCIAWQNKNTGFDENANQVGGITLLNCTSYNNEYQNFDFWEPPDTDKVINCISFIGKINLESANDYFNTWNFDITVTKDDFISLDSTSQMLPRKQDGGLPDSDFLKLKEGSQLIDKGLNIGLPFEGEAPDLGAYEFTNILGLNYKKKGNNKSTFTLANNYPNPFNILTNLEFTIHKSGLVELSVYNSLGEKVSELVNRNLTAGVYSIVFDAKKLSSGIYFTSLSSGKIRIQKKMILLK